MRIVAHIKASNNEISKILIQPINIIRKELQLKDILQQYFTSSNLQKSQTKMKSC